MSVDRAGVVAQWRLQREPSALVLDRRTLPPRGLGVRVTAWAPLASFVGLWGTAQGTIALGLLSPPPPVAGAAKQAVLRSRAAAHGGVADMAGRATEYAAARGSGVGVVHAHCGAVLDATSRGALLATAAADCTCALFWVEGDGASDGGVDLRLSPLRRVLLSSPPRGLALWGGAPRGGRWSGNLCAAADVHAVELLHPGVGEEPPLEVDTAATAYNVGTPFVRANVLRHVVDVGAAPGGALALQAEAEGLEQVPTVLLSEPVPQSPPVEDAPPSGGPEERAGGVGGKSEEGEGRARSSSPSPTSPLSEQAVQKQSKARSSPGTASSGSRGKPRKRGKARKRAHQQETPASPQQPAREESPPQAQVTAPVVQQFRTVTGGGGDVQVVEETVSLPAPVHPPSPLSPPTAPAPLPAQVPAPAPAPAPPPPVVRSPPRERSPPRVPRPSVGTPSLRRGREERERVVPYFRVAPPSECDHPPPGPWPSPLTCPPPSMRSVLPRVPSHVVMPREQRARVPPLRQARRAAAAATRRHSPHTGGDGRGPRTEGAPPRPTSAGGGPESERAFPLPPSADHAASTPALPRPVTGGGIPPRSQGTNTPPKRALSAHAGSPTFRDLRLRRRGLPPVETGVAVPSAAGAARPAPRSAGAAGTGGTRGRGRAAPHSASTVSAATPPPLSESALQPSTEAVRERPAQTRCAPTSLRPPSGTLRGGGGGGARRPYFRDPTTSAGAIGGAATAVPVGYTCDGRVTPSSHSRSHGRPPPQER